MKFFSILALAAAAMAATTATNADAAANNMAVDANNMAVNEQAEAAAPLAEADTAEAADADHWDPKHHHHHRCRSGTYSCTHDHKGWRVCQDGHWRFAGHCGHNEKCVFNRVNHSPYCLPHHRWY